MQFIKEKNNISSNGFNKRQKMKIDFMKSGNLIRSI